MDTVTALHPTTADTRPAPRARLELKWSLQHTHGQKSTLAARWVVIEPEQANRSAA